VAVLVAVVACGGHPDKNVRRGSDLSVRPPADSLRISLALDAGSYAIGEPMEMRLTVTNVTPRTVTVTFPTAQRFDFVVRRGGKPIWQWAADMMFAQSITRERIAALDSLVLGTRWDQVLPDGTNPGLGAYTLQGILKTSPERVTDEKRFGVVD
jgi:hypothetical protein